MTTRTEQPAPPSSRQPSAAPSARELRDERLRADLVPLTPGEWPPALRAAIAVAFLLAVVIAAGTATIHDLNRHGGSVPGGIFLSAVFVALAIGMLRRRYWAVAAFEALLAFQIVVCALALVVALTIYAALTCVVAIALGGVLFWKLIRVMGRIQAGEITRAVEPSCDRVAGDG